MRAPQSPERAAAVAEMRAQAEAGEPCPIRTCSRRAQTPRLAARAEPRSVADVAAIEAELAAIARRRQAAVSPAGDRRAEGARRGAAAARRAGAGRRARDRP